MTSEIEQKYQEIYEEKMKGEIAREINKRFAELTEEIRKNERERREEIRKNEQERHEEEIKKIEKQTTIIWRTVEYMFVSIMSAGITAIVMMTYLM